MASKMVGRSSCPECGFQSAHIKESEKCLYRYCPECGSQHYAKSQRQREDLMRKTRATATATDAPPAPPPADPDATATGNDATATATPPAAPPKRRGLFS